jgi:two-component sensor histidine kinase
VVDLTERLHAEEQQKLLVNELNHRVKNTLASVQALAHMTKRHATSLDDFYAAFSDRLRALSNTHNLLTSGLWESASLHDLISSELQPYAGNDGARVRISGAPVRLKPYHAINLGMVFHELATNAVKYGALSARAGRTAVSWNVERQDGGRELTVQWQEADGPPVQEPDRKGFGSRLIEETVQALGGTVEIRFLPGGLACSIRLQLRE